MYDTFGNAIQETFLRRRKEIGLNLDKVREDFKNTEAVLLEMVKKKDDYKRVVGEAGADKKIFIDLLIDMELTITSYKNKVSRLEQLDMSLTGEAAAQVELLGKNQSTRADSNRLLIQVQDTTLSKALSEFTDRLTNLGLILADFKTYTGVDDVEDKKIIRVIEKVFDQRVGDLLDNRLASFTEGIEKYIENRIPPSELQKITKGEEDFKQKISDLEYRIYEISDQINKFRRDLDKLINSVTSLMS